MKGIAYALETCGTIGSDVNAFETIKYTSLTDVGGPKYDFDKSIVSLFLAKSASHASHACVRIGSELFDVGTKARRSTRLFRS